MDMAALNSKNIKGRHAGILMVIVIRTGRDNNSAVYFPGSF